MSQGSPSYRMSVIKSFSVVWRFAVWFTAVLLSASSRLGGFVVHCGASDVPGRIFCPPRQKEPENTRKNEKNRREHRAGVSRGLSGKRWMWLTFLAVRQHTRPDRRKMGVGEQPLTRRRKMQAFFCGRCEDCFEVLGVRPNGKTAATCHRHRCPDTFSRTRTFALGDPRCCRRGIFGAESNHPASRRVQ